MNKNACSRPSADRRGAMPDVRSILQGIIENPRSTEKERDTARRRLAVMDAAEEERQKLKAKPTVTPIRPPAPAPAGVDVASARSWKPPVVQKVDISDLLPKPNQDYGEEFRSQLTPSPEDLALANELQPEKPAQPRTPEQLEWLKKEGHALFQEFKIASDRVWRSVEAGL